MSSCSFFGFVPSDDELDALSLFMETLPTSALPVWDLFRAIVRPGNGAENFQSYLSGTLNLSWGYCTGLLPYILDYVLRNPEVRSSSFVLSALDAHPEVANMMRYRKDHAGRKLNKVIRDMKRRRTYRSHRAAAKEEAAELRFAQRRS